MLKKLFGNKAFYSRLFRLMMPIMIQNGITNFVNMLDNIMIGTVGTAEMTGVAVTNQLLFVFNLCIFGAISGAGIFGAQFFGKNDVRGVHHTFRFKLLFCGVLTLLGICLFVFCGQPLLELYMQGEQGVTDVAATLRHAKDYLYIMLIGLVPYVIVQCYSSTLREGAHPTLPMIAGVTAVLVNLSLNYVLIFGKFGAPKLGVVGAAVATVISRFFELGIVVIGTHANAKRYSFMCNVYHSFYVPAKLMGQLFVKGLPLMLNETLWATGVAMVNQCYSLRGLDAVAAVNISQTFWNVFSIAYMAVGAAIGIILGQMLGADQLKQAKEESYRLITASLLISVAVALLYSICAPFIPLAYNTEPQIRQLATWLMLVTAVAMPFEALTHASYFTLRSGGKMLITILFDCGFMWGVTVLVAFLLSRFTAVDFLVLFAVVQSVSLVKAIFGLLLVKNGFWIRNIVAENEKALPTVDE